MNPELRAAMLAQVEARQAFNGLPDDASDDDVSEARQALEDADQALAELLEGATSAPSELRDRISLARYLSAIVEERAVDGAEQELRTELRISEQAIPLEALLPTPEERADAVSPQNAAGSGALGFDTINTTVGPMLSRIFSQTDAAFLRIAMPTVPPGERIYPVMTDGTDAAMTERGSAGPDAKAAKFDVVTATPHRLTGRYVFDLEGVATLGGLLESTLRSDLRTVMGRQMDLQILNGSGAAGQVSGLRTELDLELPPGFTFANNDPNAVAGYDNLKAMAVGILDGELARREGDERWLIGKDTYSLASRSYRGANADNEDALEMLRSKGVGLGLSFQIPESAVATIPPKTAKSTKKVQDAIVNVEQAAAVAPVWQGITMIRDPYTDASKAQIILTAHMLFDFVLRRKEGWHRYAIRTEA
ncbi:MAG: phage major capsid protein [Gammaproteobacteria bacterium]|nr:phage major capsid protein [Gammaproteobacteria bacterium]